MTPALVTWLCQIACFALQAVTSAWQSQPRVCCAWGKKHHMPCRASLLCFPSAVPNPFAHISTGAADAATALQASDSAKRLRDLVENERKSPPRSSRETEDDKECQQVFRDF
jgi:hypothetical protein